MKQRNLTRRGVIAAAGAAVAGGPYLARAASFPSRNIRVVIPATQGGGADRLARVFDEFWGPALRTGFEYNFFPGAAGQAGYETYINRREKDGHNLLFGNMGAEMIMYALQRPPYRFPEDYQYFCRLFVDDSVVFVRRQSPVQNIEDLVAEARRRPVNVAVGRLLHPASIGMLALGAALRGRFNLTPIGSASLALASVANAEIECGALQLTNLLAAREPVRVLGVFNDVNRLGRYTNDAPTVNSAFGIRLPALYSTRAWALHTEVIERFPDRFARLEVTAREVLDHPGYRPAYERTGAPLETIQYGDRAECTRYAQRMAEFASEYRGLLGARN